MKHKFFGYTLLSLSLASSPLAGAANLSWNGLDTLMSNTNNWNPNQAPTGGDSLFYPLPLTPTLTSFNDIGALSLNTITINGGYALQSTTPGYNLTVNSFSGVFGSSIDMGPNTLTVNAANVATGFYGTLAGTGGLTLSGGILNLFHTNSYTGPTLIENGSILNTLNLGSSGSYTFQSGGGEIAFNSNTTSAASLVLNAPSFFFTNTFDVELSGPISGNGSKLTKLGLGTLKLSGVNANAGPLSLQGGILNLNAASLGSTTAIIFENFGSTLQAGGDLAISHLITLDADGTFDTQGHTVTISGSVGGANEFIKAGAGTLFLTSTSNNYTGKTVIQAGTLNAGSSNVSPGSQHLVFSGDGTGIFQLNDTFASFTPDIVLMSNGTIDTNGFNMTATGTVAGVSATDSFTKKGAGTLTFNGPITYQGPTLIKAGTLSLGSSNYNPTPQQTLQVDTQNSSTHGLLTTTGTANLSSGKLIVNALPGFYMNEGDVSTLLTASGGLSGTQFANTQFLNFPGNLIPQISYTATDVILGTHKTPPPTPSGSHTEVVFTGFHQQHLYITRKCCQLRSRLFAANNGNGNGSVSEDMGVASDNSESYTATAEASASSPSTKATASLGGSSSLQRRIAAVQRPAAFSSGPAYTYCNEIADSQVYASSLYSTGSVETRGTQTGFNYDSVGGLLGFDRFFCDQESGGWGGIVQYKQQNARIHDNGGHTKVDQVHGNIYATYIPFCNCPYFSLNGIAGVAYAWDKLERNTGPDLSLRANARTHETLFDMLLQAEYLLSAENTSWIPCNAAISPWLGAGYIYDRIAGYQESGAGAFNLAVNAQTAQSLVSSVGARFLSLWELGGTTLLGELDLGWQHQFANGSRNVFFTAFEVNTSPATISTVQAGKDTFLVGLDLTASVGGGWEIEGSANYHLNNMYHDLTFYLGLNKRF